MHGMWYQGYARALQEAGLSLLVVTHPLNETKNLDDEFFVGGKKSLEQLLAHSRKPTAVVSYNDLVRESSSTPRG